MPRVLDVQKCRLLDQPSDPAPDRVLAPDILVAGGGMGGCAAALAACAAGRSVVLTEETDWLGGQMTAQGVSALDEHGSIERFGGTRSYYRLRGLIREYYRRFTELTPEARGDPHLNPGNGWVSFLCFEPQAALWALEQLLGPHLESGRLTLLLRHRAVSAEVEGDEVRSVLFRDLEGEAHVRVGAAFVLDATELGDLLPLTGTEYVTGAESAAETGEPNARPGRAEPGCVQSFTYPFALELCPEGEPMRDGDGTHDRIGTSPPPWGRAREGVDPSWPHATPDPLPDPPPGGRGPLTPSAGAVARPTDYEQNRERQPYTLRHLYYDSRGWVTYRMFETGVNAAGPFWTYRRLIAAENFTRRRDVAMINWPGNDYRHGNLIDVPPEEALAALEAAKRLSLGFCRWLQEECPRDEGGSGYPEMRLLPQVMGSQDGLSKYPYIRESRRIRALRTIVEQDIAAAYQPGERARPFPDSVGLGLYAIDIHPCEGEEKIPPAPARPFQIPLSALVPVRIANLLPACKNIGTTHITNGAYRLHPIEWNIGESAAYAAVRCLEAGLAPQKLAADPEEVRRLQRRLVGEGVPIYWDVEVPLGDPRFGEVQLEGVWG
jgi:hypothetical protein